MTKQEVLEQLLSIKVELMEVQKEIRKIKLEIRNREHY